MEAGGGEPRDSIRLVWHVVSLLWRCEEKGGLRREGDGRKVALPSPMGSGTCAPERAEVSRGPPLPSQAPSLHLGKVGV